MQPLSVEDIPEFQDLAHEVLYAFMTGAICQSDRRMPGRLRPRLHPAWHERIAMLAARSIPESPRPPEDFHAAAKVLAAAYRKLRISIEAAAISEPIRQVVPGAQAGLVEGTKVVQMLRDFWSHGGAEVCAGIYLHGSHSTGDVTGYSDVDTLLIIKQEVAENPDALMTLGRRAQRSMGALFSVDLLQHHGNFVLTETDLQWYDEVWFPLVLFEYSTPLFAADPLHIRVRSHGQHGARLNLERMCRRFMAEWQPRQLRTAFHLKVQLSCFLILPALLLQAHGRACYKRESFMMSKPYFDPELWGVMDEVSDMRRLWRQDNHSAWRLLAKTQPVLWHQIISTAGKFGVPAAIWRQVADPQLRARMGDFARACLALTSQQKSGVVNPGA